MVCMSVSRFLSISLCQPPPPPPLLPRPPSPIPSPFLATTSTPSSPPSSCSGTGEPSTLPTAAAAATASSLFRSFVDGFEGQGMRETPAGMGARGGMSTCSWRETVYRTTGVLFEGPPYQEINTGFECAKSDQRKGRTVLLHDIFPTMRWHLRVEPCEQCERR